MKLARSVTRFEDYVEEFELNIDMTNADVSASIVCPIVDDVRRSAKVEILDAEIGKVRVTVTNVQFTEFRFEDVYVILHMGKLARVFNPLNLWITVRRDM